jgi:Ca2+/H+ antiporter
VLRALLPYRCRYKIQHFNAVSSQTSGSLLLLSAIGIIIPTAAQRLGTTGDEEGAAVLGMLAQGMAQDKVRLTAVYACARAAYYACRYSLIASRVMHIVSVG